jgi:hypothetical protein
MTGLGCRYSYGAHHPYFAPALRVRAVIRLRHQAGQTPATTGSFSIERRPGRLRQRICDGSTAS